MCVAHTTISLRHTAWFPLLPSRRSCSSSCSKACPRLNTRGSWAINSTPSFRCTPRAYTRHLVAKRRCPGRVAGGGSGARRENHRHAARAGSPLRTPQRAQDRRPHCLPRHGALDLARQPLALAHPPGYAWCRSYWTSLMRRKRCWIVQTLLAATNPTHPTPILASSQLTVLRHVPPRAYSILGHVFFRDEPFSQATLSARRIHWRRRLRWEGLQRATPRWATPRRATLRSALGSA